MRTVGLFEAKQKLSELVERASEGEQIGITRRGKLAAVIIPARKEASVKEIFADIEEIRKSANRSKRFSVREIIEEGRV
jgi:prevent-host-death family protein